MSLSHFRSGQEILLPSWVFSEDTYTELSQPTPPAAGLVSWGPVFREEGDTLSSPVLGVPSLGLEPEGKASRKSGEVTSLSIPAPLLSPQTGLVLPPLEWWAMPAPGLCAQK